MRPRGFTLVEVLVALAVVAISVVTLVATSGHYTRQTSDLRDRSVAAWVAADVLTEYRLRRGFPEPGTERGETMQLGQRWHWLVVVSPAPGEGDLVRVDVAVAHEQRPENPLVVITGFIGRHRPGPTGVVTP